MGCLEAGVIEKDLENEIDKSKHLQGSLIRRSETRISHGAVYRRTARSLREGKSVCEGAGTLALGVL